MSANGYLTPSELTDIGNGVSLRNDAAVSFLAMAADAWADGVQINWAGAAGGYRPWAMQLDMRAHPERYGINPNMHALPGLPSSHGTGLARDVPFGAPNNWMIANAARYGWKRPERTMKLNDLNHWEFTPGTATASLDATRIEELQPIGDDMKVILHTTHDASVKVTGVLNYLVGESTLRPLTTQPEVDTATAVYGPAIAVDDGRFDLFVSMVSANAPKAVSDAAAIAKAVNDDAAKRLAQ